MAKEKLRRKQAVIDRQEGDLAAKDRSLQLAERANKEAATAVNAMRQELASCKVTLKPQDMP